VAGPVSWQALTLLVSATIIINASTAVFVGWLVFRACQVVGTLERRLQRLEMLAEARAPGAPRGGRG
jgi:hypothetical protein